MEDTHPAFVPNAYYHVYNRANGSENIFLSDDNYQFFLNRYKHHIGGIVDTFCYCLMPNHFHFLIRIKPKEELSKFSSFSKYVSAEKFVSKQFSNLFSSYTQAFNKQQGRMGSLFMKNFKRKRIHEEGYLKKLVNYIHFNPVEAKLCNMPLDYKYSSYKHLIGKSKSFLKNKEVIEWFDDLENFEYNHRKVLDLNEIWD